MTVESHSDEKNRRAAVLACVGFGALIAFCTPAAHAQDFEIEDPKGLELSVATITIASREGARGATIAVPVSISTEGPGPTTIVLILEFDDSRLSYVRSNLGSAVPSSKELQVRQIDDIIILVIFGPNIDQVANGTLLNLFFRVADDAPLVTTLITGGMDEFGDVSNAVRGEDSALNFPVPLVIVAGEITPIIGLPPIGCGAVHLGRFRGSGPVARRWGDMATILVAVASLCAAGRLRRRTPC